VQVLAAVHGYTTAFLVSGSIFVVGAVLTGGLLPCGVLRQPGSPQRPTREAVTADRRWHPRASASAGVWTSDWSVSAAVAYLFRGITRITMRVMMLKKKPRMANRMAL